MYIKTVAMKYTHYFNYKHFSDGRPDSFIFTTGFRTVVAVGYTHTHTHTHMQIM